MFFKKIYFKKIIITISINTLKTHACCKWTAKDGCRST
jgi:hypothetical protein